MIKLDMIYFLTLYDNDIRKNNVYIQERILKENDINNYYIFYNYRFPKIFGYVINNYYNLVNYNINWISCLLGHLNIIKNALYNNYENIMICEDDTEFIQDNLNDNLNELLKYIPDDYMRCNIHWNIENDIIIDDKDMNAINDFFIKINSDKIWSNKCFIINRKYMSRYIDYFENNICKALNYGYFLADYKFDINDNIYLLKEKNKVLKNTWFGSTI